MSLLTADRASTSPPPPATRGRAPFADPAPDGRRDPAWARPALGVLLAATALLYLWGLDRNGWANSFYSAAVQAGSVSWKAFFFGSFDAANAITVDKTPLSLWPMELSVRVFGLSSWSVLVPQAVEGVLAVWLLVATVRRTTGSAVAGLLAGTALATTPVAVLMFRFDNPDAMLTLLLVAAAHATLRAVASKAHPVRWIALAGALVGLAFLAKMLQAFLVVPALGLVYLWAAQSRPLKRIGHLLVGAGALVLAGGWWVAVVELWPAGSRPYIGGSQHNSILELTLGYNGLGRLTGEETGSVGGSPAGHSMWGATGLGRLLGTEVGGQVGWLLPTSLLLLGAGLWLTRRAPRTDAVRAGLLLWGAWLIVTGLTFSYMAGIFHPYYTVALAPANAALVGTGAWLLWQHRDSLLAGAFAGLTVSLTTVLAFGLLGRTPDFLPWLRWLVLVVGLATALLVVGLGRLPRRLAAVVAAAALVAGLAGPTAYAVQTAATAHSGSIPSAGPSSGAGGPAGAGPGATPPQGAPPGQTPGAAAGPGQQAGGAGGLLDGSTPSAALSAVLEEDAGDYTWVAAAVGSNVAAGYQLATQEPVMAIGGFNGSDPSPTLAQFERYVAAGRVHYFVSSGGAGLGGGQTGGSTDAQAIASWVAANFGSTTVGGVTLYDLTSPANSTSGSGTTASDTVSNT